MVDFSIKNISGGNYRMNLKHCYVSRIITVLVVLILAVPIANATEYQQATFSNAEDAVQALLAALQTDDNDALLEIFGRQYEAELMGGDEANSRENLGIITRAMLTHTDLIKHGRNNKTLIIGSENWPVPFPLVREKRRWRFDTKAGIEEVVNRRVGRNELDAINNCYAYVEAQIKYASEDRDGDEVLEYAQVITSSKDNKDGLYWETNHGEEDSPFGPFMADAKGYLRSDPGDSFRGYYYKVISRQGTNAAGGRYDYIINGNMIAGFGLIAFPADHGNSGVMTFMCNHQGKVYEKDFGPDSDLIAASIDEYNPEGSWKLVE